LRTLKFDGWQAKARSAEYATVKENLAVQGEGGSDGTMRRSLGVAGLFRSSILVVTIAERQQESSRPFDEYLGERGER